MEYNKTLTNKEYTKYLINESVEEIKSILREMYNFARLAFSKNLLNNLNRKTETNLNHSLDRNIETKLDTSLGGAIKRQYWDPQEWEWSPDPNVLKKKPREIYWDKNTMRFERRG